MIKILAIVFLFFGLKQVHAQNWDINSLRKINIHRNTKFDNLFKTITNSNMPITIGIPTAIYTYGLIKNDSIVKQKCKLLATTFIINSAITITAKKIIHRNRPYVTYPEIVMLSEEGSGSMPSGHTSSAFAFATSVSMSFPKWYIVAPSFLYATLVGYSRMHLGVHYPSDVIIGALVGTGSTYLSALINKKIFNRKSKT